MHLESMRYVAEEREEKDDHRETRSTSLRWPLLDNLVLGLNAITPIAADEEFNFEMLETVGDNVLKLYVAYFLSRKGGGLGKEGCGFEHVMQQRRKRGASGGNWSLNNRYSLEAWSHRWISNAYLCTLAMDRGIDQMMNLGFINACQQIASVKVSTKSQPSPASSSTSLKPIPFSLPSTTPAEPSSTINLSTASKNTSEKTTQTTNPFSIFISGFSHPHPPSAVFPYADTKYSNSLLSEKAIADCTEAILGASFKQGGTHGANLFFTAFGMPEMSMIEHTTLLAAESGSSSLTEVRMEAKNVDPFESSPQVPTSPSRPDIHSIEVILGYKWQKRELLEEALTHESLRPTTNLQASSSCYHSLCTLGDALFDHLVLRYILVKVPDATPGEFTHLKSIAVCGYSQSLLAHRIGLHQFLLHQSQDLEMRLRAFHRTVQAFEFVGIGKSDGKLTSADDDRSEQQLGRTVRPFWNYTGLDYPEALSLCLEAVVGALFEDVEGDVDRTWTLLQPLFVPFWDSHVLPHIGSTLSSPWPKALLASLQQHVIEVKKSEAGTSSSSSVSSSSSMSSSPSAFVPCRAYYEAPPMRMRIAAAYVVASSYHSLRALGIASTKRISQSDSALRVLYKIINIVGTALPSPLPKEKEKKEKDEAPSSSPTTPSQNKQIIHIMASLCTCPDVQRSQTTM